jgi:hypothetical protein
MRWCSVVVLVLGLNRALQRGFEGLVVLSMQWIDGLF